MNVRPKRRRSFSWDLLNLMDRAPAEEDFAANRDGEIIQIYGDYFVIETEAYSPPSAKGRKVYLFMNDQDVVEMLKLLRRHAVRTRSKAMGQ